MQKLFGMMLRCWHGVEDLHTAVFLIALRDQPFVRDGIYVLMSPVGQTAMLLTILMLVVLLHLRLTTRKSNAEGTDSHREAKARGKIARSESSPRRRRRRASPTARKQTRTTE